MIYFCYVLPENDLSLTILSVYLYFFLQIQCLCINTSCLSLSLLQVHKLADVCWEQCVDRPKDKLDSRTETCVSNCVERFIDTSLTVAQRFQKLIQQQAGMSQLLISVYLLCFSLSILSSIDFIICYSVFSLFTCFYRFMMIAID